jgi:hypothetical protein
MPARSLPVAVSVLVLGGAVSATAVAMKPSKAQSAPSGCAQSALAPYVQGLRASAASFVDDLSKIGGSSGAISSVGITLANGQHLRLAFANGTLKLSGNGVPAACKTVVAGDDWENI